MFDLDPKQSSQSLRRKKLAQDTPRTTGKSVRPKVRRKGRKQVSEAASKAEGVSISIPRSLGLAGAGLVVVQVVRQGATETDGAVSAGPA